MGRKHRHVATLHCSLCGKGFEMLKGHVREVSAVGRAYNPADASTFVVHEAYCSDECNDAAEAAKLLTCHGTEPMDGYEFRVQAYANLAVAEPKFKGIITLADADLELKWEDK